jgi:hypothetical protein
MTLLLFRQGWNKASRVSEGIHGQWQGPPQLGGLLLSGTKALQRFAILSKPPVMAVGGA